MTREKRIRIPKGKRKSPELAETDSLLDIFGIEKKSLLEIGPSRFGDISIPVSLPLNPDVPGETIKVVLLVKRKQVIPNLVRKAIKKGLTSVEWFYLYTLVEKNHKFMDPLTIILLNSVLIGTSRGQISTDFLSTVPGRKMFKSKGIPKMIHLGRYVVPFEEFILSCLNCPDSYVDTLDSYVVRVPFRRSNPVRRIGVGYKDMGGKSPDHVTKEPRSTFKFPIPSRNLRTSIRLTQEILSSGRIQREYLFSISHT